MIICYLTPTAHHDVVALKRIIPGEQDHYLVSYSDEAHARELAPSWVFRRFNEPLLWADDIVKLMTNEQRRALERLWFIYGNHGKKHSHAGHRYIQCLLENGEEHRHFFRPDQEVLDAVSNILYTSGRRAD